MLAAKLATSPVTDSDTCRGESRGAWQHARVSTRSRSPTATPTTGNRRKSHAVLLCCAVPGRRRLEIRNLFTKNHLQIYVRSLPLNLSLVPNRMLRGRQRRPWTDRASRISDRSRAAVPAVAVLFVDARRTGPAIREPRPLTSKGRRQSGVHSVSMIEPTARQCAFRLGTGSRVRSRSHSNLSPMFDTHVIARKLTGAALTQDLADATTDGVREAVEHGDHVTPESLRAELAELRSYLSPCYTDPSRRHRWSERGNRRSRDCHASAYWQTQPTGRRPRARRSMPRLLQVLLIGLAIPVFGFVVSTWILFDVNADLADKDIPPVQEICATGARGTIRAFCDSMAPILFLRDGSMYAGSLGAGLPILFWFASALGGQSRTRITVIFPALVRLSIVLLAVMVLAQGAIFTYAVWLGESHLVGRVHVQLILLVGFGAIVGAGGLISASLSVRPRLRMRVAGRQVTPESEPRLHSFVQALAARLGARPPDNIIVGLDPTFFVTSADISVQGALLTGESLFVSTSLSRLLSADEFAAVIGHELGHFRGSDTQYSLKFTPVYAGLDQATHVLTNFNDFRALAGMPALSVLSYMQDVFSTNVRAIGREREIVADSAGAEASSPEALAAALVKVSTYGRLWEVVRSRNVERLNAGKIDSNLGSTFENVARYVGEHDSIDDVRSQVLEVRIAHPTDTHPPTSERLKALGVDQTRLGRDILTIPDAPAAQILHGLVDIEEELTVVEHVTMVALGLISEAGQEKIAQHAGRSRSS